VHDAAEWYLLASFCAMLRFRFVYIRVYPWPLMNCQNEFRRSQLILKSW